METVRYYLHFDNVTNEDARIFIIRIDAAIEEDALRLFIQEMVTYLNSEETDQEKGWKLESNMKIRECEGCELEAPGQRSHMQCPDGCLHSPGCGECDQLPYPFSYYE